MLHYRISSVVFFLTVFSTAWAEGYSPYVARMDGPLASAGKVYWATPDLAGTQSGVYERRPGGWHQTLVGREVLALGVHPTGWWAAGLGFVALANGRTYAVDDRLAGGCLTSAGLFLSGSRGVWLLGADVPRLVFSGTLVDRFRIFPAEEGVALLAGGKTYRWTGSDFAAAADWLGFPERDVISAETSNGGGYFLSPRGIFHRTPRGVTQVFAAASAAVGKVPFVGFSVGEANVVFASYADGLKAYDHAGTLVWSVSVQALGGNPYSLLRVPEGFLVGTSAGAVTLFSELVHHLPRSGEDILSVTGVHVRSVAGVMDVRDGSLRKSGGFSEAGGAAGHWDFVLLPSGKKAMLPGREVFFLCRYRERGWLALQETSLSFIDESGDVIARVVVPAADSALLHGDDLWIGSAVGLFRWSEKGGLVQELANTAVRVVERSGAPLFVLDSALRFLDGTLLKLPGRVVAVAADHVALDTVTGLAIGSIARRIWEPYALPGVLDGVSFLAATNDYLYAVAPRDILRFPVAALRKVELAAPAESRVDLRGADFERRLPVRLPPPWPQPEYEVRLNGDVIPISANRIFVPRMPYGTSNVQVVTKLAGLESQETIRVTRMRPWWLGAWGAAIFAALLALVVWASTRWRTRMLTRKAQELQRLVAERTEALNAALKAREFFFSSVSHEIRNPLNGVVGLCGMLNESEIGARERVLVRTLKSCSDQLRRILDDVLDFSRIDRGQIEFFPEPFDFGSAIEASSRAVDPGLERIRLDVPENVWVEGDAGKVRQIVTNLVSNALKYGVPSLARVEGRAVTLADGRRELTVAVSNSGPDLAEDERERIFAGFHRGEDARRRRLPGSGLGLALSRRLARAMKGDVTVTSSGGLTVFCLQVTFAPSAPPPAEVPRVVDRTSKALAIEDELYNRIFLGRLLGQLGYEVDWAVDGAAAIEALREGSYDLILSDYMLPDIDGVTLVKQMVAMLPDPRPPIVMVTAYSTQEKQDAAFAAGASGFVVKPIDADKLRRALLGLGYNLRGRRSVDLYRPEGRFDFAVFRRMPDGRAVLGRFADDLATDYGALARLVGQPAALRKAAHALRGRALVVHATALAEQFASLEVAAESADPEQIGRMLAIIDPMVQDLAETARDLILSAGIMQLRAR